MSNTKYLPVEVLAVKSNGESKVRCNDIQGGWYVEPEELKTADDLKAEGAEEYRKALKKFASSDSVKCVKIWGTCLWCEAIDMASSEFISKLEAYENFPKVGEIWERNRDGAKVVVMSNDERGVVYSCRNTVSNDFVVVCYSLNGFKKDFCNTGKTCESLMPFLEELEGLKE